LLLAVLRLLRTRENRKFRTFVPSQGNWGRVGDALHTSLNHDS
jgi:hypothetical protein